jgi:hypothetical protein
MSVIQDFLEATDESESPKAFFYWSFLAAVAGVVNNKIYLERYFYKLYPNIYVLLFGKSGLRKGVPVNLAKRFVQVVNNTRVISGRISIQALLTELGKTYSRPDGKPPISDAIGFVSASEFASSMVEDDQALTILTDLYDGHYNTEWKNILKSTGTDKLKNVNLTLLGGINSPHFNQAVSISNIQGGFIGRTFIIYETKRNRINSLIQRPLMSIDEIVERFSELFFQMAALHGDMLWTAGGKEFYNEWYNEYVKMDLESEDETGTVMRLGDHVLKVAMLLAVTELRLELTFDDIQDAINSCLNFTNNAKIVTHSASPDVSPLGKLVHEILKALYKTAEKRLSKKQVMRQLYKYGTCSSEIDICIDSLLQMGFLMSDGNVHDQYYTLTDAGIAASEGFFGK